MTLQAVPPPNRPLQASDLKRSVEILRDRIDALGVAEPEIRESGDDQISIGIPGVKDPERVIEILGKTAQLELYDLEKNLVSPSIDANGFPVATSSIHQLLARQQALIKNDNASSWYLFDDKKKVVAGPASSKQKLLDSQALEEARGEGATGDELPKGWRLFGVPPKTVVLECGTGEVVCPGVNVENPTSNSYYLIRHDPSNADEENVVPEMTGEHLRLSGTRQDFDTQTGEPIVTMSFTDKGGDIFGRITGDDRQPWAHQVEPARPDGDAALRDRPRPRDQVVAVDRLGAVSERDRRLERRSDHRHRLDRRGEGPRDRAPERCPAGHLPDARDDRHLGHARRGLAPRGLAGADRRPARRRHLPARLLPLPRPRRRGRPRRLRGVPLRDDPHLRRHADAPGLRGHDPDARRRGRREHRHLRTHQGRGPRRQIRACSGRERLREGLQDDHRRERRHRHHGRDPVRARDVGRARLRLPAPARHRALGRHRRLCHARLPRAARQRALVRQPQVHGRRGARDPRVAADRLRRQAAHLVHHRRHPDHALARRSRLQGPEPRHRLRGRHRDHVHDAAADRARGRPGGGRERRSGGGPDPGHG